MVAANIGRTKPTRGSQPKEKHCKKNDGRPPDTTKELISAISSKKKGPTQQLLDFRPIPKSIMLGRPSYPWKENSWWLDISLELIFMTVMRDFADFSTHCEMLPKVLALGKCMRDLMNGDRIK